MTCDQAPVPGAEPFAAPGGPHGVLLLHGFTGCPQSLRRLAEAVADAGFAVELPLLPGHGTTLDDMATTSWADWSACAEAAYLELASGCERVVVGGLSMGGTLAVWLAIHHPEIAGVVAINAMVEPPPPSVRDLARRLLAEGYATFPAVADDIADPSAHQLAYDAVPLEGFLTACEADDVVVASLGLVTCPVLVVTSAHDHVVPPTSSELLAAKVSGPVERVTLEHSYHVATLDYDKDQLERQVVAFAQRVTAS